MQGASAFHVDHYRPKKYFSDLITDYNNLYYSCAACNLYKGDYWSEIDNKVIVNPSDYVMSEHLKFNDEIISPLSRSGKTTVELLRLNNEDSIKYRHIMRRLISELLRTLSQIDLRNKQEQTEETLELLAQLIGENVDTIKSAVKIL